MEIQNWHYQANIQLIWDDNNLEFGVYYANSKIRKFSKLQILYLRN